MVRLPLAAQACMFSQGERESGRAGVLDSTSSTLAALNAANTKRLRSKCWVSQIRVRSRESVKFPG